MSNLAMVLAGGESPGLGVLSALRSEAALPFAGKYRVIDFTLSNCVNSGIYNVAVLTQYEPRSLNTHIGTGRPWDLDRAHGGIRLLQPYQTRRLQMGAWQDGTADAIRFNLDALDPADENVLILAGDHIYKMDYNRLLETHVASKADVTLAVRPVSPHDAHRFGMVGVDGDSKVTSFEEKPARTRNTLASMGVYVFRSDVLVEWLTGQGHSDHDFGRDVIPRLLEHGRVGAHQFAGYWMDVGNVQAYFEASMALLAETPALDLYDPSWVIHTRSEERPAAFIGPDARVDRSLLCDGSWLEGTAIRSIISPGVRIAQGAVVRDSIIMNDTVVEADAVVDHAVLDKRITVGRGARVGDGDDQTANERSSQRLSTGLTVVGKGTRLPAKISIGRNVEIGHHLSEGDLPSDRVSSGATVGL